MTVKELLKKIKWMSEGEYTEWFDDRAYFATHVS